jgi:hypothetical protein
MALSSERSMGQGEAEAVILSQYKIYAFWGPRPESTEVLAARFIRLINQLTPLHPVFSNWIWVSLDGIPTSFESRRNNLVQAIADNVARDDWGKEVPREGYYAGVVNTDDKTTPRSVSVGASAARQHGGYNANYADIQTGWRIEPDPSIVTYAVFKSALLALAETYDVDWCSAYPNDIMDLWPRGQLYRMPWMCYIKPAWGPLVTPPNTAIVEYRPNGALFMAATDETFITSNPAHLSVARDIEAALAPLNALRAKEDSAA